jgi:hypothetical protein
MPRAQIPKTSVYAFPIGLGLTVSRDLARLMEGNLVYRRTNGESIFEMTLPTSETTT